MNDQDMHRVLDQLFQANPTFSFLFECSSPLDGGLHSSRVMLGVQEAQQQEAGVPPMSPASIQVDQLFLTT